MKLIIKNNIICRLLMLKSLATPLLLTNDDSNPLTLREFATWYLRLLS